jgi:hypothetical protein
MKLNKKNIIKCLWHCDKNSYFVDYVYCDCKEKSKVMDYKIVFYQLPKNAYSLNTLRSEFKIYNEYHAGSRYVVLINKSQNKEND